MGFFELCGFLVIIYYLVTFIFWSILDADIELAFYEKFGKPISSLRGKVVWISGAASGLGKNLAITLARNGVRLCLSDIQMDELERVKSECLNASKSSLEDKDIFLLYMDMVDLDMHETYFEMVLKHFNGQLDVLVNNAGLVQRGSWPTIDIGVDREIIELDVFSHVNLSRIYMRHIEKHKLHGHIFVTASVAGIMPTSLSASYSGAKYAVVGYFSSLKAEYPNMDVTIFCPGPTFSNFMRDALTNRKGERLNKNQSPSDNRMKTDRCAFLMATAIANKLYLNFCGPFPWVIIIYLSCYYPNLFKLMLKILGEGALARLRDSSKKINQLN